MKEIRLHQEATDREMKVLQRVQALALVEVNLAEKDKGNELKMMFIPKDMIEDDKQRLTALLKQYKDVFA